jgi:hypothetical protein
LPSLPCITIPRQTLAGNGGLGRDVYLLADWRVQDFEEDLRDEDFFEEDLRDETLRDIFLAGALRADLRFGADI